MSPLNYHSVGKILSYQKLTFIIIIISNRYQFYIQPDQIPALPLSLVINHDGAAYQIFLVEEGITCLQCKQVGQISTNCPETNSDQIPEPSVSRMEGKISIDCPEMKNNQIPIANVSRAENTIDENFTLPVHSSGLKTLKNRGVSTR